MSIHEFHSFDVERILLDLLLNSKWPFATEIIQVEGDGHRVVVQMEANKFSKSSWNQGKTKAE